jgi:hypothetical protein
MQFGRGLIGAEARPGINRSVNALAVDRETHRQRLEERNARAGGQFGIGAEDFPRERHARGLAAPGQQLLAQFHEARRACRSVTAPVARAVDQRAAALRNGLQHLAEEGGIHFTIPIAAQSRTALSDAENNGKFP